MSPEDFNAWRTAVKSAGKARFDVDIARLLGVNPHSITIFRREGVKGRNALRTALACGAIAANIKPWSKGETQ